MFAHDEVSAAGNAPHAGNGEDEAARPEHPFEPPLPATEWDSWKSMRDLA